MAKKWVEYGLLLTGCLIFYIFWRDYLSFFVLRFFLFLPLLSLVLLFPMVKGVRVKLAVGSASPQKGWTVPLKIKVRSSSIAFAGRIRIKLLLQNETFQLETKETLYLNVGRAEQLVEHQFSPEYCGAVTCCLTELKVYDMLGLFSYTRHLEDRYRLTFTVLPSVLSPEVELGKGTDGNPSGDVFSQTKPGNDPSELFGIREYQDGDKPSQIHWKLSGKLGRAVVKEGGLLMEEKRLLLVDLCGEPEYLNSLMDVLAALSQFLSEQQEEYLIGWYDGAGGVYTEQAVSPGQTYRQAVEQLLSTAKPQKTLAALEHYTGNAEGCSHVIYLTSKLFSSTAAVFQDQFPIGRKTVLLVCPDRKAEPINTDASIELVAVDPLQIETSLKGFEL